MKNRIRKIVLTGGPGVGKTSILETLSELNFDTRKEVFTDIFAKAHEAGSFNEEFLRSAELLEKLISSQKALEAREAKSEFLFLDRCRADILGFCKNLEIHPPESDSNWLNKNEYDLVFIIEPLPARFYEQNSIRRQTQTEALDHHNKIIEHYTTFSKVNKLDPEDFLVKVPFIEAPKKESVHLRTEFILNTLKNKFQIK